MEKNIIWNRATSIITKDFIHMAASGENSHKRIGIIFIEKKLRQFHSVNQNFGVIILMFHILHQKYSC